MKTLLIGEFNNVCDGLSDIFPTTNEMDKADVVVIWNDISQLSLAIVQLAKLKNKKVIVLQHGRRASNDYEKHPLLADVFCAWGPRDYNKMLELGFDKKRIAMTGSTIFNRLRPREQHEGNNVVFLPAHLEYEMQENYAIRDKLRNINGINVITKIIEVHKKEDFDNVIYSDRSFKDHIDKCVDALVKADLVVGACEDGTFELMAYAMDIPCIVVDFGERNPSLDNISFDRYFSNACDVVDLDELEPAIIDNLMNPKKLSSERLKMAYDDGGIGLTGNPRDKIIEVINKI